MMVVVATNVIMDVIVNVANLTINGAAECHKDCIGNFKPIEGKIYTVTETVNWYGMDWYLLKEDNGGNGWNIIYFIPVRMNKFDTILKAVLTVPKKQMVK